MFEWGADEKSFLSSLPSPLPPSFPPSPELSTAWLGSVPDVCRVESTSPGDVVAELVLPSDSSFAFQSSKESRSSSSVGWGSMGGSGIRQHICSCPSLGRLRAIARNGSLWVVGAARTGYAKRREIRRRGSEKDFMAEINTLLHLLSKRDKKSSRGVTSARGKGGRRGGRVSVHYLARMRS